MKFVFLLGIAISFVACAQKTIAPVVQEPIPAQIAMEKSKSGMTFDQPQIDIGMIKKGETKEIEYTFTNTGTEDLEIAQVSTCDCTQVET